jgi:hypothetical protein
MNHNPGFHPELEPLLQKVVHQDQCGLARAVHISWEETDLIAVCLASFVRNILGQSLSAYA